jgi:hypothetical protein
VLEMGQPTSKIFSHQTKLIGETITMATKPIKPSPMPAIGSTPGKAAAPAAIPPKAGAMGPRPSYIPKQDYDVPVDDQFQPTIKIVQMISNELVEGDPAFIEGARAGMLFNSSTKELYDGKQGLVLIPLQVRKYWTEWIPRQQGGGFVAQYETKEEMQATADKDNEIVSVFEFICMMEHNHEMVRVQFNTATKYPVARKWGQLIQESGTLCGMRYKLTTSVRQNNQKQSYYTFDIAAEGWSPEDLFKAADEMARTLSTPLLPENGGNAGEM